MVKAKVAPRLGAAYCHHHRRRSELPIQARDLGQELGRQRMRRQRACAVAGMDARLLDVLHDAGDEHRLGVGDQVDVDLDRVVQVAIDQDRPRSVKRPPKVKANQLRLGLDGKAKKVLYA
jgi:hypothetical protein